MNIEAIQAELDKMSQRLADALQQAPLILPSGMSLRVWHVQRIRLAFERVFALARDSLVKPTPEDETIDMWHSEASEDHA